MNNNSLHSVQNTLQKRGVQNISFLFNREAYAKLPSDVSADIADVLSKYFDGKFVDLGGLKDEVLPETFM